MTPQRYLAHGDTQQMIVLSYRVGRSTACRIIRKTCQTLWNVLQPKFLKKPATDDWLSIAYDFHTKWQFPNCVGAIDGKHVVMQSPANSGSEYFNYKGTHSVVLMAACDANYKFTWVDIGSAGRDSDGGIFGYTECGNRLMKQTLNLPPPSVLPGTDVVLPYVFVADEAFPLTPNIMRPYAGRSKDALSPCEAIFNYRLCRARRLIENTFGVLTTKWRIFRRAITADVETVKLIIMTTVALHNYLKDCDQLERSSSGLYCSPGLVDSENGV
ncbi:uncharacterized protein LOC126482349 [Schistocerca serialis cubense]|uniref:uncharacterized protein LOC126482349 n=1 Tax=Schistocerca serialis cubense TaxID=2023355 RepID=UPI00214EC2F3|nr:uncharacterized protein LOC126482349 [Schistocerca serialis cubense]